MKKELSFLLALALSLGATAQAQTVVQARSLPVLEMGADARAVAMGGNHYGTSRSAHLYTNPASIVFEPTGALIHASASWRHQAAFEGISGSLDTYSLTGGVRLGDHAIMLGGALLPKPQDHGHRWQRGTWGERAPPRLYDRPRVCLASR